MDALIEFVDKANLFPEIIDGNAARNLQALQMIGDADLFITFASVDRLRLVTTTAITAAICLKPPCRTNRTDRRTIRQLKHSKWNDHSRAIESFPISTT